MQKFAAALAVVLFVSVPAYAHHGWGTYQDKEFEVSGTVAALVSLQGPHATMRIKDAEGHVWDITMAPPNRTQAAGLKEGMIPLGAPVTLHGHRAKDMKRFEVKTERLTWNGKVYNVYPDRD